MATVYYYPYVAIRYKGKKSKIFRESLARPKPTLKNGDIVIVDELTAYNLTKKGFGDFEKVTEIKFVKTEKETAIVLEEKDKKIEELEKLLAETNNQETDDHKENI